MCIGLEKRGLRLDWDWDNRRRQDCDWNARENNFECDESFSGGTKPLGDETEAKLDWIGLN